MSAFSEHLCVPAGRASAVPCLQPARRLRQLLAATALMLLAATPAMAAAVGMVTDLTGKAWAGEGAARQPLAILSYLDAATVVEVEKGGSVSVTFYSPAEEQVFAGPSKFRIEKQGVTKISGAAPTVQRLGALAADATAKDINQGGRRTQAAVRMRNLVTPAAIVALSPDKTAVRSTTPQFSWRSLPDIAKYRVTVTGADGAAVLEETVAGAAWRVPAEKALMPGKDYSWSVEATLADGAKVAAKANFSVVNAETATRLAAESPKTDASFAQRLRHAITLEAAGLNEDAREMWRALASERPTEPAVLKRAQP